MISHTLAWQHGKAEVLTTAAMLADCTFFVNGKPFRPFARAPWMGTIQDRSIIGHLRELGGDFVGVPFGSGSRGETALPDWAPLMDYPPTHPIHGPSGDTEWTIIEATERSITLSLAYPATSPIKRLERTITVRNDVPALDFTLTIHARRTAETSIGLHPIFRLPEHRGDLVLSAEFAFGLTHPRQTAPGQAQEFWDLSAVPQGNSHVDLAHPPLAQPNLNVQLCGMQSPITATYTSEGAGVVLDWDRNLLPSLQIWHTDRGIDGPPWHGRYRGLGLEPIAAAFDLSDAASTSPNPINRRGVATSIRISEDKPTTIRHSVTAFTISTV